MAVTRSGAREEIPLDTRRAVYRRDGWACQHCYVTYAGGRDAELAYDALHIDHIVPWSAGGSDLGENLRTLCRYCNETRSNFVDIAPSRPLPVTWWCTSCYGRRGNEEDGFFYYVKPRPEWVRVPWFAPQDWPDDEHVRAYCSWCDSIGYTVAGLCI